MLAYKYVVLEWVRSSQLQLAPFASGILRHVDRSNIR